MGDPYFTSRGQNRFVEPRFHPGEQGPYEDPVGQAGYQGPPVPERTPWGLRNPEDFRRAVGEMYGGSLSPQQAEAVEKILRHGSGIPTPDLAYAFATADHETGQFRHRDEIGRGRGYAYGEPGRNDGQRPYGRGYVQITGDANYAAFDDLLNLGGALVANYDLANDPEIAAQILIKGLTRDGGFTGAGGTRRYFGDHDVADMGLFRQARRAVNGPSEDPQVADRIARRAIQFQDALVAAGYLPRPHQND